MITKSLSKRLQALALSSTSHRRVGCILMRKGKILVSTTNMDGKTHPKQSYFASKAGEPYRISLHAEMRALLNKKSIKCDTLIVCRVNKNGKFCMSKPCPVCQLAIAECENIERVIYSTDDETWEEM